MNDALAALAARADLARLLAACYYEPEQDFAAEGMFDALAAAAVAVDPALEPHARALGAGFAATPLQQLRIDYTRLFIGPQRALAPPYGSVWIEQAPTLMQDSSLAVQQLYRDAGFDLAEDFRELPDHVAAELEFLYALSFRRAQARQAQAADDEVQVLGWRRQLLDDHLGRWCAPFCGALEREAETDFYRALARLTAGFVDAEQRAG